MNEDVKLLVPMAAMADRRCSRRSLVAWLASVVPVLIVACGSGGPDYRPVDTLAMDEGSLEVEWAPGDAAAYVRLRKVDGGADVVLYEGRISNDGGTITLDNIRPDVSQPPTLHLCLNGSEQEDLYVRVDMSSLMVVEIERECTR